MPEMELIAVEQGDKEAVGRTFLTLRQIRDHFADSYEDGVYKLRDPDGNVHTFSLDRWKDRDPDRTLLQIAFRFRSKARLTGRRSLFP